MSNKNIIICLTNFQYDFGFDLPFVSNISLALMQNCSLAYFIILLTLFRWVLRRRKWELFCFTCLWSRSLIRIALLIDELNQGLSFGRIVMISSEKQATGPGLKQIRLIRSPKKFIFRYQDLVEIYSVSAETIISDAFSFSENV